MATFAYGDSCVSGDDKYVIAQFRHDADLGWVAELRAFLVKDELKYRWLRSEIHRVRAKPRLWSRLEKGVHEAEVTIVDPLLYKKSAVLELLHQQAVPGVDFDLQAVNKICGKQMIEDSPLGTVAYSERDFLNSLFFDSTTADPYAFTADRLQYRAGGRLKDAVVISARSHAMITPSETVELIATCRGADAPDFLTRLHSISKLSRAFDIEHPKSLPILNEFSERLAHAAGVPQQLSHVFLSNHPVREAQSADNDHIQAADIAAGWAVDLLTLSNGDYRSLAQRFAWVGVNGIVVPG